MQVWLFTKDYLIFIFKSLTRKVISYEVKLSILLTWSFNSAGLLKLVVNTYHWQDSCQHVPYSSCWQGWIKRLRTHFDKLLQVWFKHFPAVIRLVQACCEDVLFTRLLQTCCEVVTTIALATTCQQSEITTWYQLIGIILSAASSVTK